jgi:hypothetical protein
MDHNGTRTFEATGEYTAKVILLRVHRLTSMTASYHLSLSVRRGLDGDSAECKGVTQWGPSGGKLWVTFFFFFFKSLYLYTAQQVKE